jgi:hypothetical protein
MKTKITSKIILTLLLGWIISCASGQTTQPKETNPNIAQEEATKRGIFEIGKSLEFVYQPYGKGWKYKNVSLDAQDFQKWYNQNKDKIMEVINNLGNDYVLEIVGHTDESGPREAQPELGKKGNIWYSTERAKGVYNALIKAGVDKNKIRAIGVAEDELIPGLDPYDQRHRRVTFRVNKK